MASQPAQLEAQLLLKEYDTLRAEMLQRMQQRFNLLTFFVAAAAFGVGQGGLTNSTKVVISVIVVTAVAALLWFYFWTGNRACSRQVVHIEGLLNGLIEKPGTMSWETTCQKSKWRRMFEWVP